MRFRLTLFQNSEIMKNILFISLAIVVGLCSCKKEVVDGNIKTNSKLASELKSSPEAIMIGNNNLILETYLWRDFMPVAEVGGSKLLCVNKLTDIDSLAILNTISLKKQYVINGDEIWMADYTAVTNNPPHILQGSTQNGPKWGPDIYVDVVCEFEHAGTTYRIIAKSQMIYKTQ